MTAVARESALIDQFDATRERTLELVRTLERDDFVVQTAPYMSPPKWHLGHVSWIYEAIMSKISPGYEFYSGDLAGYLNSYYQQFGSPMDKGRRGVVSRPTLEQIFDYFEETNRRVRGFIEGGLSPDNSRMITMGTHHECQHQELLIYDLQHLLASEYRPARRGTEPKPAGETGGTVRVKGGLYTLGYGGGGFCYDVELPEHRVYLEDYTIGAYPVTNGEYLLFMEDGGYGSYRHWLSDGWDRVKENGWNSPMYWEKEGDEWYTNGLAGRRKINPKEPVCHVSFYEADAYCRWAGKRLPTEAEWEKAALWNEEEQTKSVFPWGDGAPSEDRANLYESGLWKCTEAGSYPEGASPSGCHQMVGDAWEWTSSEFVGYPGFRSGFDEYNDKWFTGQKVLRGGSYATPSMAIRGTYRNFFRLDERWMFCGFRCAGDAPA
ncbi:conserved hypothetical protein [Cenarchaeum symbiosum A]|uniref:Sulfatase-modifying factor enzyme domain-containing protein n=1 Tax=Cenarchaeum symbiosum (strain A) TaxID=414004 RepID=A0RUJ0_CENSY|nr:conserved hypothetical protein [Cenarchaeum symbiosum A]